MKDLFEKADEIPVTLVVVLAYITMAFLTGFTTADGKLLQEYGSMSPISVSEGEAWRLIAGAFLHINVLHLGFNTWAMLTFGPALEQALGSVRLALLYLISAVGGHIAVCFVYAPQQGVVGGSGALFGMMGAVVAYQMRQGRNAFSFLDHEGPRRILSMIAINIVIGVMVPFISNTGHMGGLITGFLVTFLWLVPPREPQRGLNAWRIAIAALLCSLTFYCLVPTTRYDWLWNRGVATFDAGRGGRLRKAAVMSWSGKSKVDRSDTTRFQTMLFRDRSERDK